MSSEEEHEERWSEVDEDVFEVEQNGEKCSAKVEIILRDPSRSVQAISGSGRMATHLLRGNKTPQQNAE